ncbi:MAG: rhodanese-like domain-containing protein [Prochlorococcaceae cyanobacterium ETNP7_MAG_30]|jgi:rhodanese-related sulfurtransferase|nr:rhodanese-like domain-containing protein [Prochlorococcaceae cyanobacterium ETNP2_MAG_10]MDP6196647.1 rhodanese-like domain-containing protein [Prochlorococcaceae cyanobacterium ETNP18_MAG_17]MDP7328145.1 rhodanese-like domain-containing protein [Prochlorococcaceae cyanobacterium ETNP7_MAG_30]HJL68577.1 rhodanese-like domain-containing protein [Prochlorococcaceae cyanobacterium Gl_MAG_24]|tara:strand:+ start:159 stop:512 length:354 start_codon:yes stop_codon:yes gene_type:complete
MNQPKPTPISARDLHRWLTDSTSLPICVDVREDKELELAPFPAPVLHLPLSRSSSWIDTLPNNLPSDCPVVVICHAGIRSWDFGSWLLQQNLGHQVFNLEGGIEAWSCNVDPSVPRY